ncbi:arsenate reductase ArsC [Methanobacterium alcaliphilum]|uniref:arsenate reductase ArsC n=1 Tax=Methanobacterium alcaliphilum TaxID=392018 RepID=UPI00200AB830|nr:arsenate reductase ArsC [Methanobacterium alcaliphilum]MCK9151081.1 arsenate reductase ArsC [Methanobacterium alcaliphilum]
MRSYKNKVLFICENNSCRSQLAESLLREIYGDYYEVYSAGSDPKEINPITIEVLSGIGIDISEKKSKSLNDFKEYEFDYVVSLCGEEDEVCPVFINTRKHIHKGFRDPQAFTGDDAAKIKYFREIMNEIKLWIENEFEVKY